MKKQGIIIGITLSLCLLCLCVYLYNRLRQEAVVPAVAAFQAVPPDALIVQKFNSLAHFCGVYASPASVPARFCPSNNGLSEFLDKLYAAARENADYKALFESQVVSSVHYTGKNTLQVLLAIYLADPLAQEAFMKLLYAQFGAVTDYKKYNKTDIYQLFEGPSSLYVAVAGKFVVAATSLVMVESSVRHIVSGRSILDQGGFSDALTSSASAGPSHLYVNVQQFDKIVSSLLGRRMQPYADFLSKSASWMALNGAMTERFTHLSGPLSTDNGMGNYASVVAGQPASPVKLWEYLPAHTLLFLSLSFQDIAAYRNSYGNYLEIHKRDRAAAARIQAWEEKNQIKLETWVESLHPVEAALAWLPHKSKSQWITLVRSQHVAQMRRQLGLGTDSRQASRIFPNPYSGAFSAFLGPFFAKNTESHYTIIDNVLFLGDEEALELLHAGHNRSSSLYARMRQSGASGWMEEAGLTLMIQAGEARDSLISLSDSRYRSQIAEALSPYDYAFALFQLRGINKRAFANLVFGADMLRKSGSSSRTVSAGALDTEPQAMATGPFRVYNHATLKYNRLEQSPDSLLTLIDEAGKTLWKSRIKYPISDTLAQIDYLRNNKLQMLFASGTNLQLLDRLGRTVNPYPRPLEARVRKGPFVFDPQRNKNYLIFLIHTDNSLRLYDRRGAADRNWEAFMPEDRIERAPVLLSHAKVVYWLVYGVQNDYVLNASGVPVVTLQRRDRIKQDASLTLDSGDVLQATTVDGRLLTVELSTGSIKTRTP